MATLRAKVLVLFGATAFAFGIATGASAILRAREAASLESLQQKLVPMLELAPRLELAFGRLTRGFQDAAASEDEDALEATNAMHQRLLDVVDSGAAALGAAHTAALRRAIDGYNRAALDVTHRLIARESGPAIRHAVAGLQQRRERLQAIIRTASTVDRKQVVGEFARARAARETLRDVRLSINLACLAVLLALSIWLSRDVLGRIRSLSTGIDRFAQGDFSASIEATGKDELAALARQANAMARSLAELIEHHERSDWLKSGRALLTEQLRGALSATEVAQRSVAALAKYVDAVAGIVYFRNENACFQPLASHAASRAPGTPPERSFAAGEGLVGQAALGTEVVSVDDLPTDYFTIRSGLGETAPSCLLLVPLRHTDETLGVLELAFLRPPEEQVIGLLESVSLSIAIAFEAATNREATERLLAETREQAALLGAQEEELRVHNEQLRVQQHDLQRANDELEEQRQILSSQNAELEEARERLFDKAKELEQISSYKTDFLTSMSHELRTPLNSMLLLSALLADKEAGQLSDQQVEYCRTIHGAGQSLLSLINDLLDLSRIEAGKQVMHFGDASLQGLAERMERVFRPLADNKHLAFEVTLDENLPDEIRTDEKRLGQVLTNLLGNAIKFTSEGRVSLHIARATRGALQAEADATEPIAFVVSDTGPGIAAAEQERVFEPFEQVQGGQAGGTGLGLAITRKLVLCLGGELLLESTPGRGSTFTVQLPARGPREDVAEARSTAAPTSPSTLPAKPVTPLPAVSSPRILIIEDDALFADQIGDVVRARGFEALIARTGAEGLQLARSRPQGIVLDVGLPDMNGFDLMKDLRRDPVTAAIPVHFVTALDSPEEALALGAIGYLTKPVQARSQLVEVVRKIEAAAELRSGRLLLLDLETYSDETLFGLFSEEGFQVTRVTDPDSALSCLAQQAFDALVLSVDRIDDDGLVLLRRLRPTAGAPELARPGLVVYATEASADAAMRARASADAVVLRDGRSAERVLAEVRLFAQHVQENLGEPQRPAAATPNPSLEGLTLLLVDDDMRTLYALSAMVQGKGARVVTADNGLRALQALEGHPDVDCVVMDIMMPRMDGYEAMRRIRSQDRHASLPIIAVTAKAMATEEAACVAAGATAYLPKPVNHALLLQLIHAHVTAHTTADRSERAPNAAGAES